MLVDLLNEIASEPSETFVSNVMNFEDLERLIQGILADVCLVIERESLQ